jgi:glycosyltransferase involved in cell wall biosynthesis
MGAKSGFPLHRIIKSILAPSPVVSINIPSTDPPPPFLYRLARKLPLLYFVAHYADPIKSSPYGSPWSSARHSFAARKALTILQHDPQAVLLLSASENEFCSDLALASDHLKRRIFLCFHQPPAWFRLNWRCYNDFSSLGGIIALGKNQEAFFRSICQTPVLAVNHGVEHEFFTPPFDPCRRHGNRLLFVGHWLRDFDTLSAAMALVWLSRPDIQLDCVIPTFARSSDSLWRLAMDDRVTWHSSLSDEDLRDVYQAADLLFLPLLDSVANNALLEALSSGLPVISTRVGAVSEYLPVGAGELCTPSDPQSHADAVIRWLDDHQKRKHASKVARNETLRNYAWHSICQQILDFMEVQYSINANPISKKIDIT